MNNKIAIFILILISTFSFSTEAIANSDKIKAELLQQLNNVTSDDTTRLGICYKLMRLADNPQVELYYVNRLMKDAERLNHSKYKCLAYLGRMTLAYNNYDVEEVNRWMRCLEPIVEREKLYDYFFLGKRCVIDMMMIKGEYEREEKEAEKMLHRAKILDNKIGITLAYQCLSNVYSMTYRNDEAVDVKEKAFEVAILCDVDLAMEINSSLIGIYEQMGDRKKQLKWMKIMDEHLDKSIKENPALEDRYSLWISMNLVSYLNYYTTAGDLKEAAVYLKRLDKYADYGYDTFMVKLYMARCNYFQKVNMLDEALKDVDKLIEIYKKDVSLKTYVSIVYLKANLLTKMGREDEAISMYKRNLWLSDSINIVVLNKQTEQIKGDYKTDTLLLEKENIHWNIQRMILLLIIIVIVILIFFVVHTKRIQKQLEVSEKEMRQMAEQMEQANEAKEKFLSTISTSINTPLNVVVTDSLRLATDEVVDPQERSEISKNLNKTSAGLMKLINNILNLSKLEAGMMKFKEEDTEMISYVQSIGSIKKYEGCPVVLILPETIEPLITHIDAERLREVFNHVLVPFSADAEVILELKVNENEVELLITGSVLAVESHLQTQEEAIGNEVARLTIVHFGGQYEIVSTTSPGVIRFTLPLIKEG